MVGEEKPAGVLKPETMNNVGMLNAFKQEPGFDVWR